MKPFHSMRWRLQFWYGLLFTFVLIGFGLSAFEFERSTLVRSTDAELERRVGTLARILRNVATPGGRQPRPRAPAPPGGPPDPGPGGPGPEGLPLPPDPLETEAEAGPPRPLGRELRVPPQEEAAYAADPQGGWYYVVWLHNGPAETRSANAPAGVPLPESVDLRARMPHTRIRGDVREAFLPLAPGDVVLVGRTMTADYLSLRRYAWELVLSGGGILGLALLGGRWLVGRSLRPLATISEAATRIAAGKLNHRIAVTDSQGELGQLAVVLNETFARLEANFVQQARFTADAAHELRTPVTVLLTHTQNALAAPCLVEEHQEAFAACQRAARRMHGLIESLLRLARLEAADRSSRQAPCDLAARVADCLELVRPLAAERGLTLSTELRPAVCRGAPEELDQVVINLLTNAVLYNREKGEITVSTGVEGGTAVLRVTDRGLGIAPADAAHIFDRFYRADASRSRASGGSGLGLAIVKAIVDAHGGTIEVQSVPGAGSSFVVSLPRLA